MGKVRCFAGTFCRLSNSGQLTTVVDEGLDPTVKSPTVRSKRLRRNEENVNVVKGSAKRRIDFRDQSHEEMEVRTSDQCNNNATRKINRRSATAKEPVHNSKVQWTKEFLDKIRKSNDKCKKQENQVSNKFSKVMVSENFPCVLQASANDVSQSETQQQQTKGDGIETTFNAEDFEELDYDDDLSIDEEIFPVPEDEEDFEVLT